MIVGAGEDPVEDTLGYFSAIGPAARALLRHRRDLPDEVAQALQAVQRAFHGVLHGVGGAGGVHDLRRPLLADVLVDAMRGRTPRP